MYRYVQSAGLLKSLMTRIGNSFKGALAEAFTGTPKQKKVKDPDTGAIGNLYVYEGKKNGPSLNVETYPFPGIGNSFIVRCYLAKENKVLPDTIMILNNKKGKAIMPIRTKQISAELAEYCDLFKKQLGVRNMKKAQQEFADELDNEQESDGFEASQYDDTPEDDTIESEE